MNVVLFHIVSLYAASGAGLGLRYCMRSGRVSMATRRPGHGVPWRRGARAWRNASRAMVSWSRAGDHGPGMGRGERGADRAGRGPLPDRERARRYGSGSAAHCARTGTVVNNRDSEGSATVCAGACAAIDALHLVSSLGASGAHPFALHEFTGIGSGTDAEGTPASTLGAFGIGDRLHARHYQPAQGAEIARQGRIAARGPLMGIPRMADGISQQLAPYPDRDRGRVTVRAEANHVSRAHPAPLGGCSGGAVATARVFLENGARTVDERHIAPGAVGLADRATRGHGQRAKLARAANCDVSADARGFGGRDVSAHDPNLQHFPGFWVFAAARRDGDYWRAVN